MLRINILVTIYNVCVRVIVWKKFILYFFYNSRMCVFLFFHFPLGGSSTEKRTDKKTCKQSTIHTGKRKEGKYIWNQFGGGGVNYSILFWVKTLQFGRKVGTPIKIKTKN